MAAKKIRPTVRALLDRNSHLSDAERIRRLEIFEAEYRANLASPHGPTRQQARNSLDLLAALRERAAREQP